jgi:hypothetical protein
MANLVALSVLNGAARVDPFRVAFPARRVSACFGEDALCRYERRKPDDRTARPVWTIDNSVVGLGADHIR